MLRFKMTATLVAGFCILLLGCGGGRHQPPGKLTKGGAPLSLSDKAVVQLSFIGDSGETFPTTWQKDGTFTITGKDGGIPNGKYKSSIAIIDPYPGGKDILNGKYAGGNGPVVEVNGNKEIVIDLAK